MSKLVLTKRINAIFLVIVLISGIIEISSPIFSIYGQVYEEYEKDKKYYSYNSYKPEMKYGESGSPAYQSAICDDTNVDINGIDQKQIQRQTENNNLDSAAAKAQQLTPEEEIEALNTLIGNDGPLLNLEKSIINLCSNTNDNFVDAEFFGTQEQLPPPPLDTTETLTVIKNTDCAADAQTCEQNSIQPSGFTIVIEEENNPSPMRFQGSSTGTNVELEEGRYSVTEEGLDTTTPPAICTTIGYEAGRIASDLGENLFICTNFSDECEGDITVGKPLTCTIENVLVEQNAFGDNV